MAAIQKKLVIIGDGAVGKTMILVTFVTNKFPEKPIFDIYKKYISTLEVDNNQVELELWDATGMDGYKFFRALGYPNTDVIIMCFSVNSFESLLNIPEKWMPEVRKYCPLDVPIILVATQIDLRDDEYTKRRLAKNNREPMTMLFGRDMAERIGAYAYMECSALTKEGLREVFEMAVDAALERQSQADSSTPRPLLSETHQNVSSCEQDFSK